MDASTQPYTQTHKTHTHTCMHANMHLSTHTHKHKHAHTHKHTHIHTHNENTHTYTHIHTHTNTHTHARTQTQTHSHTYSHTHTLDIKLPSHSACLPSLAEWEGFSMISQIISSRKWMVVCHHNTCIQWYTHNTLYFTRFSIFSSGLVQWCLFLVNYFFKSSVYIDLNTFHPIYVVFGIFFVYLPSFIHWSSWVIIGCALR